MLDSEHIQAALGRGDVLKLDSGAGEVPARVVELPFKLADEKLRPRQRL